MRSYIIHMRGDLKRQENVRHLLKTLPDARISDAIRGQEVMETTAISRGGHHEPAYPFALGGGEVGCFLSHRQCWQRLIDNDEEFALIVEDDVQIDPAIWPEVLDLIQAHASADTYIRLPVKNREKAATIAAQRDTAQLILPRVIGLQTVAQVVGRNAAERLLAASDVLDRPVDSFLQMHWVTGQPVHSIYPNGFRELTDELGGSTIQKKTRAENFVTREIKRMLYRARIEARPQKL